MLHIHFHLLLFFSHLLWLKTCTRLAPIFVPFSGHSLIMMAYENKMFPRDQKCACKCVCVCVHRLIHSSINYFSFWCTIHYVWAQLLMVPFVKFPFFAPCMGSPVDWPFEHRSLYTTLFIHSEFQFCLHISPSSPSLQHDCMNRLCHIFRLWKVPFSIWTTSIRIYGCINFAKMSVQDSYIRVRKARKMQNLVRSTGRREPVTFRSNTHHSSCM